PMPGKEFAALPPEEKEAIGKKIEAIQEEVELAVREINKNNQEMSQAVDKWVSQVALFVVKQRMDSLKESFSEAPDILNYLDAVQADIVENVSDFLPAREAPPAMESLMTPAEDPFQKYRVNILVDRRGTQGAPVVFETNPNFYNLFGRIEKRAHMGTVSTHFSMVQAGSLLRANGGFLILEIESVLMSSQVWEALKRALQNKRLFLEDPPTEMGRGSFSLRPQPIPLAVKVVLVGSYSLFQLLQNNDSKFNKIFKVRADFDFEVKRDSSTTQKYAQLIARSCKRLDLKHFTPQGVAAMVDQGVRQAGDRDKLSIRFGPLLDLLQEAHYWAEQAQASLVSAEHVERALKECRFRYNLYEEKIHQSFVDGSILLDLEGAVVGQVNALAVYQIGDIAFGRPSRITAETYLGKRGVINIEREAKLSGKTHDKGVLILSGFLGRTFAQERPLSLAISITFEQSYGGIDGDSASSTELYAILSSLSGVPIRQGIAVTGSVNQKGEVQSIGGANEKIEGFFDVCREKGFNGNQGVLIPQTNAKNLMLKPSVAAAVRAGQFHIWSVATVAEGIEVLTGQIAGEPDEQGRFPEDSIFGRVQSQLDRYHQKALLARKGRATLDEAQA
ncbi:MAG: ATP-binding protein, partial [Desulfobacterales bacterium]